jgi:hypothetical protein
MNTIICEAYVCGNCGLKHFSKEFVDRCCMPYNCSVCGTALDKYHMICEVCAEKERYEKATKTRASTYSGWVYWEGHGYNEGYFDNIESLKRYCNCHTKELLPYYVWACEKITHGLYGSDIIDNAYEEAYEGAKDQLVMVDELEAFCERFNEANKDVVSYYPNYNVALILKEEIGHGQN